MKGTQILGRNKSGITRDLGLARTMLAGMEEFPPSSKGNEQGLAAERVAYARAGEPIATMPPPASVGKLAKSALEKVTRGHPDLYLDKLGARLAFERTGVRLYEALISKLDAYGGFANGPSRDDLQHLRDEEHEHFTLLSDAIEEAGGDPTAVTPSANVEATASMGIEKVLADPRTNLLQCLEAMQIAELADNDCWQALIDLTDAAAEPERAARFNEALEQEREHLMKVRTWVAAGQSREPVAIGGAEPAPPTRAVAARTRRKASAGPARPGKAAKAKHRARTAAKRGNGARRAAAAGGKARAKKSAAKSTGKASASKRGRKGGKAAAARR